MKTIIYCFTGTGNSLRVSKLYQEELGDTTIHLIREDNKEIPNPNDFERVIFSYPIHGFNAPEIVLKFAKKLPNVDKLPTYIVKTSGEGLHLNDCSSQKLIRIIKKKGFDVCIERHIVMPYNMIYRHVDPMAKQMWVYAKALSHINCEEIKQGKRYKVRQPVYKKWYAPIVRIEQPFAHIHGKAFKVDYKKCIGCNACINNCPTGNITKVGDKYKFGTKCVLCVSCSFNCPKSAIKPGIFNWGWKVNGSYHVEKLIKDENIEFPYINGKEKGIYKIYRKYYRECDKRLKEAGVDIKNYLE